MASIQDLKNNLNDQIDHTNNVADSAVTAIDTLLNLSQFVLATLAIVIALLALFGIGAIFIGARKAAEKVADAHLKSYIKGESFLELMERKIAESVEKRWQGTLVVNNLNVPDKHPGEPPPFPTSSDGGQKDDP